jgi:hypothetical protein
MRGTRAKNGVQISAAHPLPMAEINDCSWMRGGRRRRPPSLDARARGRVACHARGQGRGSHRACCWCQRIWARSQQDGGDAECSRRPHICCSSTPCDSPSPWSLRNPSPPVLPASPRPPPRRLTLPPPRAIPTHGRRRHARATAASSRRGPPPARVVPMPGRRLRPSPHWPPQSSSTATRSMPAPCAASRIPAPASRRCLTTSSCRPSARPHAARPCARSPSARAPAFAAALLDARGRKGLGEEENGEDWAS